MSVRASIGSLLMMVGLVPIVVLAEQVPVRLENRGQPVLVKQFRDGVQCDLSPLGRGPYAIGLDHRFLTRRHLDRGLVAGEPVDFVFLRQVQAQARIGNAHADARGVRARLVPEAGLEYRVRVQHHPMQLDAVVEARAVGSHDAYERVPVTLSYDVDDFCLRGSRGGYAAR